MRLVRIPNLKYETFTALREAILTHVPFALINDVYDSTIEDGTGYLYFWDSDYVPKPLKPFIVQPPAAREPIDEMTQAIMTVWHMDQTQHL